MGGASGSFSRLASWLDTGAITENERRNMASGAQLNPDWVEWLMGWLVGWTDLKCNAPRAYAIDADPATLAETDAAFVPRVTGRRENRARRIMAIGNGQVPICAALAFSDGLAALSVEAVT